VAYAFVVLILLLSGVRLGAGEAWVTTTSMLQPRFCHQAIRLDDGRVLVVGGIGLTSCEIYDPATATWSMTGSTVQPFGGQQPHMPLLRLADGRIMAIGSAADWQDCEIYDPGTGVWSSAAQLPDLRAAPHGAVLPDGRVLVTGGRDDSTASTFGTSWIYDTGTDAWTSTGSEITARSGAGCTRLSDGRILVSGGIWLLNGSGMTLTSCESFDGSGWSARGAFTGFRTEHAALLLADDRVLIVAGSGWGNLQTSEVYQLATNMWSVAGDISMPRSDFASAALLDGRAIILGGGPFTYSANGYATSELFDPVTGNWSAGPTMHAVHHYTTATVLVSGQVLVTGGAGDGALVPYATCELLVFAPQITSAASASGVADSAFTYVITANNVPTSYAADGLPPGLTIDADTGLISGIPTAAGTSLVTVRAINGGGSVSQVLTLIVSPPPGSTPQSITFGPINDRMYGMPPFPLQATASSGLSVVWSVISGPAGISGSLVTVTGIGNVVVAANQPGDGDYAAAVQVTQEFEVVGSSVPLESQGDAGTGCGAGSAVGMVLFSLFGLGLGRRTAEHAARTVFPATGWNRLGLILLASLMFMARDEAVEESIEGLGPPYAADAFLGNQVSPQVDDLHVGYVGTYGHIRRDLDSSAKDSTGSFMESGIGLGLSRSLSRYVGSWPNGWVADVEFEVDRATIGNSNGSAGRQSTFLGLIGIGPRWCVSATAADRIDIGVSVVAGGGYAAYANDYTASANGFSGDTHIDADGPAFQCGARITARWIWESGWGSGLDVGLVRRYTWLAGQATTRWSGVPEASAAYGSTDMVTGVCVSYRIELRL
jgi:hypothetical protein